MHMAAAGCLNHSADFDIVVETEFDLPGLIRSFAFL